MNMQKKHLDFLQNLGKISISKIKKFNYFLKYLEKF